MINFILKDMGGLCSSGARCRFISSWLKIFTLLMPCSPPKILLAIYLGDISPIIASILARSLTDVITSLFQFDKLFILVYSNLLEES